MYRKLYFLYISSLTSHFNKMRKSYFDYKITLLKLLGSIIGFIIATRAVGSPYCPRTGIKPRAQWGGYTISAGLTTTVSIVFVLGMKKTKKTTIPQRSPTGHTTPRYVRDLTRTPSSSSSTVYRISPLTHTHTRLLCYN